MARRALWRGTFTLGGVTVPVKLYTAVREARPLFHLLHDQDEVRLRQQMVCPLDEKPVERQEVLKGFEVEQDQFVLVSDKDIDALAPAPGRDIEFLQFLAPDALDPRHFDSAYYVGPDGNQVRFAALVRAVRESGRAGLCRWVMRKRTYQAVLVPFGETVCLVTLRAADQVIAADTLTVPEAKISERELRAARFLIKELAGPFKQDAYRDDYQQRLREMIERKSLKRGAPAKRKRMAKKKRAPNALVAALEASVKAARARKARGRRKVQAG